MDIPINETHDPQLRSWVVSANDPETDFPIQNLPFAIFRRQGLSETYRGGVAIGDQILDLGAALRHGVFLGSVADVASRALGTSLNLLMASDPEEVGTLRLALSRLLREHCSNREAVESCLVPQSAAEFDLPAQVGDYTDFYTSLHHATAVGRLYRPDNPLLPNYRWVPIGYHGRASSIAVSGQGLVRPWGQRLVGDKPELGPTQRLDYELELGAFVGSGNSLGSSIDIGAAERHIFGLCLLNDWSARDIQAWEYQPLGPFLSKSFATSISPWIVTLEALQPYRVPWSRSALDTQPLAYLDNPTVRARGAINIELSVEFRTTAMRQAGMAGQVLSTSNFQDAYWTLAQMVAHHTVNGCNLKPGDLLGTGTQSGPRPEEAGSLLELSAGGKRPLAVGNGESRTFLEDGDEVTFRARCAHPGAAQIGFGTVSGRILPARG